MESVCRVSIFVTLLTYDGSAAYSTLVVDCHVGKDWILSGLSLGDAEEWKLQAYSKVTDEKR